MENLELNYQELAFIMNMKVASAKELFAKILNTEKPKTFDALKVKDLAKEFNSIKSVDPRYKGQNELIFNMNHKSELYKKYLTKPSFIKVNRFTGSQKIFYKICSKEQLFHASKIINDRHIDFIDRFNKNAVNPKKYILQYK